MHGCGYYSKHIRPPINQADLRDLVAEAKALMTLQYMCGLPRTKKVVLTIKRLLGCDKTKYKTKCHQEYIERTMSILVVTYPHIVLRTANARSFILDFMPLRKNVLDNW